jgi:hypothetical protein
VYEIILYVCYLFFCGEAKRNILMYRPVFLVNVESEGPYEPQRLPLEAIRVMREKISTLKAAAEALGAQGDPDGGIQVADT